MTIFCIALVSRLDCFPFLKLLPVANDAVSIAETK